MLIRLSFIVIHFTLFGKKDKVSSAFVFLLMSPLIFSLHRASLSALAFFRFTKVTYADDRFLFYLGACDRNTKGMIFLFIVV